MPEMPVKSAPPFTVDALTLHETRLLQLTLTDVFPAPATPLIYAVSSRAEVLFNAQLDESLRVDVHATITDKAKAKRGSAKPRVQIQLAVLFRYTGLGELRRSNALPLPLAWTAVSIAYSTLRGMLQVKLAGTSFAHVLLPIINPQQLWQPVTSSQADSDHVASD